MRVSTHVFIETNFFKVRYIIENASNNVDWNQDDSLTLPDVSFERIDRDNLCDLDAIYQYENNENYLKKLRKRIDEPAMWQGFIARYDTKPAGCFWMLVPQTEEILYDSFQVTEKMILFCGAYVTPFYRGRRIYNAMQYHAYKMLKNDYPDRKLVIIVERSNQSSLRSLLRSKYLAISGKNYLLKLMGRNILSLYIPKSGDTKIWFVI